MVDTEYNKYGTAEGLLTSDEKIEDIISNEISDTEPNLQNVKKL